MAAANSPAFPLHVYEVRPRKDKRGVDLISDTLPSGRLGFGEPNAVSNAIEYAKHRSRSHRAVIRVYDETGTVIETHEHAGATKSTARKLIIVGAVVVAILIGLYAILDSLGPFSRFLSYGLRERRTESAEPPPPPAYPPTTSLPPSSVELVDQSVRQLDWGNIVFNAPASMRYAQPQTIELLLSPSLSVADLQAQLQQKVGAESARVQISNRMEAQLTGSGFAIEAHMHVQWVTSQQTRWTWKVTPTGHGPQTLHLTLSAYIDVAGRDAPLVVRTFDREIQVNITIAQRASGFIQKNWQWLWAAILVPIAGYLWKRRRKAHRRPKQDKEKLDAGAKKIRAEQKAKRERERQESKAADKPKRRSPLP